MAKKLAFTAICMALSIICLFGASVAPTATIALFAVSSVFCAIVISEFGPMYGFLHYLGVSILALLLVPKRLHVFLYILLIGYYPIVKLFVERIRKIWLEWIIKVGFFNAILVGAYFLFASLFLPHMAVNATINAFVLKYFWLIVLAIEALFVIFDLMLSVVLTYYRQRLRGHLKFIH